VVGQAKRFATEIAQGVKRATSVLKRLALEDLRQQLDEMVALVRQVMKQTRARIFRANTRSEGKLLSLFEPSTEVIRKDKAGKPNEGKMVKLQEAENQIVIDYEVYARRPNDSDLLLAAIETHQARLGRTPRLVAGDAACYSAKNEAAAKARGVKRVCIPNRSTTDAFQRAHIFTEQPQLASGLLSPKILEPSRTQRGAARSAIAMQDAALAARIDVQAHTVADLDRRLGQIDSAIEEAAKRGRTTIALTAFAAQRKSREALVEQRRAEASTLADLKAERSALGAKGRQIETEAAPIRYVAQLLGVDTDSERAIRWLIALMVLTCDPPGNRDNCCGVGTALTPTFCTVLVAVQWGGIMPSIGGPMTDNVTNFTAYAAKVG
jgi:hypothetical protein